MADDLASLFRQEFEESASDKTVLRVVSDHAGRPCDLTGLFIEDQLDCQSFVYTIDPSNAVLYRDAETALASYCVSTSWMKNPPKVVAEQLDSINLNKELALRVAAERKKVQRVGKKNALDNGTIYIATNRAFPGWIKIGMALLHENRSASYKTYSPAKSYPYKMEYAVSVGNRRDAENIAKHALKSFPHEGEWYCVAVETAIDILKNSLNS